MTVLPFLWNWIISIIDPDAFIVVLWDANTISPKKLIFRVYWHIFSIQILIEGFSLLLWHFCIEKLCSREQITYLNRKGNFTLFSARNLKFSEGFGVHLWVAFKDRSHDVNELISKPCQSNCKRYPQGVQRDLLLWDTSYQYITILID